MLAEQLASDAGFQRVADCLTTGLSATLGGVWGGSRALVSAGLAHRCPATLIVVGARQAELDRLAEALPLFTDSTVLRFPAWETEPSQSVAGDTTFATRLRTLRALQSQTPEQCPRIVVASIQALMQPTPSRDTIAAATRTLKVGERLDIDAWTAWLSGQGAHQCSSVELPGEFALRGGILDLYPIDSEHPLRIELFGDEIESIRPFEVATQRSLGGLKSASIVMLQPGPADRSHATAYVPDASWFLLIEPADVVEEARFYVERSTRPRDIHSPNTTLAEIYKYSSVTASGVPAGSLEETQHLGFESVERFSGDVHKVRGELETVGAQQDVYVVCPTPAEVERLSELFGDSPLLTSQRLRFVVGNLGEGFRYVATRTLVLSSGELFNRHDVVRGSIRQVAARAIDSFLELREGDLVVHVTHGIGRYRGIKLIAKEGCAEEHLELEYHGGTRIFVPASKIELVQKYVGGKKLKPPLARIGGKSWIKQKEAAERATTDLAAEMLELQARRDARPGVCFPQDTHWQQEFDASFPFQETPDQLTAIEAIKADMQAPRSMDRLLCGDVGFGKTEVAMRAAFKAVDAGYQVAVLAPTTVLVEQHRRTFRERMAEFPFEIAALSRFCTQGEQTKLIRRAKEGSIDVLIGTHRLASPDVEFHNLGLLVIDEEQRFGVAVKERLKAIRSSVDVLTMTATPIPRTLHMALLGVRSISNLETPPADRLAVETRVTRFSDEMIRHALLRELNRGGQAYFVHNRIADILAVARKIEQIVPEARVGVGHGRMNEHELEEVMTRFVRHEYDVLLATTIIESGLDIPNANTMFIDGADRYGLADLHQLRGRVGRAQRRAYCYLLVDEDRRLSPESARRLRAIEEFHQLGAGFALAMRDLEIRGAGNLLGTEQSGHIAMVGYEMYCSLLEKAVRRLKKMAPRDTVDVTIDLPVEAYLPADYAGDMRTRIDLYRRLARAATEGEVTDFGAELVDRFGALPPPVERMLELARLRVFAHGWGVNLLRREDNYLVCGYASASKIRKLVEASGGRLRVADSSSAYLPLAPGRTAPADLLEAARSLLRPAGAAA